MWFRPKQSWARLHDRLDEIERQARRNQDALEELEDKLRRFMGRENQRLRREVLAETSTPDSSPGQMNGEEYMNWVNDPISRRIRAERAMARKRRNDLSGTTDRETSSATPSDSSLTPLTPPLPGWPR